MTDDRPADIVIDVDARKRKARQRAEQQLQLRLNAMSLRRQGASYQAIADALDISRTRAHQIVREELDRLTTQLGHSTEQLRALELERLDSLLVKLERQLKGTDVTRSRTAKDGTVTTEKFNRAPNVGLYFAYARINERRAKLLGLDRPTKLQFVDPHATDDLSEQQLDDEIAKLQKQTAPTLALVPKRTAS